MKSFCIIGLDAFARSLVETLAEDHKQVMIIDSDAEAVTELADLVMSPVIGDPTREGVLRTAGVTDYECCIVSMQGEINDSVLVTLLLKELGCKYIIVRACDERHKKVLEHIGADLVVFPEEDMGARLAFRLGRNNVTEFVEFRGYQLMEFDVPEEWLGKNMIELNIRDTYKLNVVALRVPEEKDKVNVLPNPKRIFKEGDRVTVIGTEKSINTLFRRVKSVRENG